MRSKRTIIARGFTLLEILLSIAILGSSLAIIGNGFNSSIKNIEQARQEVRATLIAESVMSQVAAGAIAPETTEGEYDLDPRWHYSLSVEPMTDVEGLLSVKVAVARNDIAQPKSVTLARWITDPLWLEEQAATLAAQKEAEAAAAAPAPTSATGGSTSAGASGSAGTGGMN